MIPNWFVDHIAQVILTWFSAHWRKISCHKVGIVVFIWHLCHGVYIPPLRAKNKMQWESICQWLSIYGHSFVLWCCRYDSGLYWNCHLFLGYWVSLSVCFNLHSHGGMVDVGSSSMQQVVKPSQFDDLANGANCCLHAASFDLASSSSCTLPDPSSKKL